MDVSKKNFVAITEYPSENNPFSDEDDLDLVSQNDPYLMQDDLHVVNHKPSDSSYDNIIKTPQATSTLPSDIKQKKDYTPYYQLGLFVGVLLSAVGIGLLLLSEIVSHSIPLKVIGFLSVALGFSCLMLLGYKYISVIHRKIENEKDYSATLNASISAHVKGKNILQQKNELLESKYESLSKKLESSEKNSCLLKKEVAQKDEQICFLKEDISNKDNALAVKNRDLSMMKDTISTLTDSLKKSNDCIEEHKKDIQKTEEEKNGIEKKKDEYKAKYHSYKTQLSLEQKVLNQSKDSLSQLIKEYKTLSSSFGVLKDRMHLISGLLVSKGIIEKGKDLDDLSENVFESVMNQMKKCINRDV